MKTTVRMISTSVSETLRDGALDEVGAVVDRDDLHALGQARFDLLDLRLHPVDHVERVLALAHHDDARDRLAGPVEVREAAAQVGPEHHLADVADADRRAALAGRDHDRLEVGDRLGVPAAADHVLGAAELDQAAAGLGVAAADGVDDRPDREAVVAEAVGIDVDLVLAPEPADRGHLRHAGDRLQVVLEIPVLVRAQVGERALARGVHQHVLEDPAEARRVGPQLGLRVLRQAREHAGEVLERARAGPVDVGVVVEDDVDERVAEVGEAADGPDVGRAEHGGDDRVGDLRLDEVGAAVPARVDDDLVLAEVGDRVERHVAERPRAGDGGRADQQQDTNLLRTEKSMMRLIIGLSGLRPGPAFGLWRPGCALSRVAGQSTGLERPRPLPDFDVLVRRLLELLLAVERAEVVRLALVLDLARRRPSGRRPCRRPGPSRSWRPRRPALRGRHRRRIGAFAAGAVAARGRGRRPGTSPARPRTSSCTRRSRSNTCGRRGWRSAPPRPPSSRPRPCRRPGRSSALKTPADTAFMRLSESRRKLAAATTRSPSIRPLTISTRSPSRQPVSTRLASKFPLPRSTNTVLRRPESKTASAGTVMAGGISTSSSTSTNMSG